MWRCCLIHLKESSTFHLSLYNSDMVRTSYSMLFVILTLTGQQWFIYIWLDRLIKKRPVKHYRTLSTNLTKINLLTKTLLSNHYNYYPILNLSILNHSAKIILFLIHYTLSVWKSGRKRSYQTFNQLINRTIRSALINKKIDSI